MLLHKVMAWVYTPLDDALDNAGDKKVGMLLFP